MPRAELSEFRSTRERTSSLVAGLTDDEVSDRPAPEKWSVGEVVDHLLTTERLWRREIAELIHLKRSHRQPYLSRLLADFPIPLVGRLPAPLLGLLAVPLTAFNTFVPTRLFLAFLRHRALPVKAPPALAPRRGLAASDLRRDLVSQARTTAAVFEDNEDLRFDRLIYQHPLLGIVDAVDILRVITVHEKRHQDQIVSILSQLGIRGRA